MFEMDGPMLNLDGSSCAISGRDSAKNARRYWRLRYGATALLASLIALFTLCRGAAAQQPQEASTRGDDGLQSEVWISDVCWLDNERVAGTQSQGLLLREGKLLTAQVATLAETQTIGSTPSSLWALVAFLPDAGQGVGTQERGKKSEGGDRVQVGKVKSAGCYTSSYKGGIQFHQFDGSETRTLRELDAKLRWCRALAMGPERDVLLAGSEDGKLARIDLQTGRMMDVVEAHAAAIFDIAFGPNGKRVATCGADGKIALYSWPELELIGELHEGREVLWSVAFVGDDKLVSGGSGRRVRLWDLSTERLECSLATAHDWVSSLTVLPDSQVVLATCFNGELLVCDPESKTLLRRTKVADSAIWSAALSPDLKRLMMGTRQHGFVCLDIPDWGQAKALAARQAASRVPPKPSGAESE